MRTLEAALSALRDKGLIEVICKGKYRLNPNYYFKGSTADRKRVLNMQATYDFQDADETNFQD